MVAFVAVISVFTLFEGLPAVLLTPAVIVTGALVSGIGAVVLGWFALGTIVEYAPVHDREKDELTSGVTE